MKNPLPLTNAEGEVRELTTDDFKKAVPFSALPESLKTTLININVRGKQKSPIKISTTVRFDKEVIVSFKATGKGWQTRMNDALKEWLNEHAIN